MKNGVKPHAAASYNSAGDVAVNINSQDKKGSVVSFHHVTYTVPVSAGCCKPKGQKVILDGVSGMFRPGMNAILGPTGSGKSSLLDVLAGRKDRSGLQGRVLIDGQLQPNNFKCMSGYVVQEDIVMGTLTVRENLTFSANLRLPKHFPGDRAGRVEEVIRELGLTRIADAKVGTEFIRGISGGEKKRCNIGMELITSPGVLFLDEPTTGLDASTAGAVMTMLWRLGRAGRTVIFSIHQPRYSIFRRFDTLVLLGAGKLAYHGPAAGALDYFTSIGYECEEHNNPADFFLDVVNGDASALNPALEDAITAVEADEGAGSEVCTSLAESFAKSSQHQELEREEKQILRAFESQTSVEMKQNRQTGDYHTGFCTQLNWVSRRAVLNLWRNPQASVMQIVVMIIFSLLVGALYWNVANTNTEGLQNRAGAFFFIIMNMVFGNLSAVELFINERALFIHQNVSGYYRVSAYFLGRVLSDSIPMRVIPVSVFCAICYFMIGLETSAAKFFVFLVTLILTTLAATSIAFFFSATVRNFGLANLFISLAYVVMMIFGGLLVNLSSIGDWLEWLKYISLFRYSLNALSINELSGLELCAYHKNGTLDKCNTQFSADYLEDFLGITNASDPWTLWQNHVALGSMTAIFFFLAYIQLLRVKKLK